MSDISISYKLAVLGTSTHFLALLHRASERGHLNVARLLIEHGARANVQDAEKSTPSHASSQGGHLSVSGVLLVAGADANGDSSTPLHLASQGGHLDIVRVLLNHGAEAWTEDGVKSTPLHAASQGGHLDVDRVLLEHATEAGAQDKDGWTLLHRASENGHLGVVRRLPDHGADARVPDGDRWSLLHRVSSITARTPERRAGGPRARRQPERGDEAEVDGAALGVARVLLEHGADASAKTKHKWTALHLAAERGHLEIAGVLLEHGTSASAQNDKNWTPFQEASGEWASWDYAVTFGTWNRGVGIQSPWGRRRCLGSYYRVIRTDGFPAQPLEDHPTCEYQYYCTCMSRSTPRISK